MRRDNAPPQKASSVRPWYTLHAKHAHLHPEMKPASQRLEASFFPATRQGWLNRGLRTSVYPGRRPSSARHVAKLHAIYLTSQIPPSTRHPPHTHTPKTAVRGMHHRLICSDGPSRFGFLLCPVLSVWPGAASRHLARGCARRVTWVEGLADNATELGYTPFTKYNIRHKYIYWGFPKPYTHQISCINNRTKPNMLISLVLV